MAGLGGLKCQFVGIDGAENNLNALGGWGVALLGRVLGLGWWKEPLGPITHEGSLFYADRTAATIDEVKSYEIYT